MERKYNRGIDYGHGMANIDPNTGIRYGVIPGNELPGWALEEFTPDYGEPSCPSCGSECGDGRYFDDRPICLNCGGELSPDNVYPDSPYSWILDKDGYQAQQHEDNDIFVFRSPYYTRASFCSPCAPGACYLTNPCSDGEKAYCFNHDWFEGGTAPYPVYRIDTDKLVNPGEV